MPPTAYVGRLPQGVQKQDVEDHFKGFGRIVDIRLMSNFGFVEFENSDDVEAAASALNGKEFQGDRLIVEPSRDTRRRDFYDGGMPPRRGPRPSRGVRVSVTNLSSSTSWQDLKDFGRSASDAILFADIDRSGQGTIEYPTLADAEDAIRRLDGTELHGSAVKVEMAPADDRAGGFGGGFGGGYDRPPPRDFGYGGRGDSYRGGGGYDDRRGGGGGDRYEGRGYDRGFDDRRRDDRRFDDRRGGDRYDDRRDDRREPREPRDREPREREPRDREPRDREPRDDRRDDRYARERSPRRERDYPAA